MAEFIKDLTWTRRTFPPRGARGMPSTLDEIVSPTVDILGSTRFEDVEFELVTGTLGLASIEGQVVPSTEVFLVLGADLTHDDATARVLLTMILNKTGTLTVKLPGDQLAATPNSGFTRVAVALNRFYLGPGERLRGESAGMTAGNRLFLRMRWLRLPLGELVRL